MKTKRCEARAFLSKINPQINLAHSAGVRTHDPFCSHSALINGLSKAPAGDSPDGPSHSQPVSGPGDSVRPLDSAGWGPPADWGWGLGAPWLLTL